VKLLSATVRNYRIHRETRVDFDPSRSLIGGPNESGKSTFIEAVHRGLFLKSKITGGGQGGMLSDIHSGNPEVEIVFTAEGKEYKVIKRFSGSNGTTTLIETGGASWQGDEAESRLNALLQVEDVGGGRGISDRILQQWAHLWVWQGKSGNDPCGDAASQQTALLQRLQEEGGAVAMQSECDTRVAGRFAERYASLFTQAGKPKAGSELQQAESTLQTAREAQQKAASRRDRLVQAMADFEEAEETIKRCTADLESLTRQRNEVVGKLAEAGELKSQEEQQALTASRAKEKFEDLNNANNQIDALRRAIQDLETAIAPKQAECEQASSKRRTLHTRAQDAARAYDAAMEESRRIRQRRELARYWVEYFDCETRCNELSKRLEDAHRIREAIKSLRDELAQLPEIDADALENLRKLKSHVDQAEAALNAMASGIEVIEADQPVRIGGQEAPSGSAHTVTEATDVLIGGKVHLRIQPGGENRLAEAREARRTAREELSAALDRLGVDSVEKAAETLSTRESIGAGMEREESRLESLDDGSLEDSLAEAREALATAKGEVDRRSKLVSAAEEPADRDDAVAWRNREDQALEQAEDDEAEKKAEDQAAKDVLKEAESALQELSARIDQEREEISNKQAQLRLLIENHGEDEPRLRTLREAEQARSAAQEALARTHAALAELRPEQLELDQERLNRAIQTQESQKQDAVEKRATSRAALTLDGTEDPQAELIRANAREQAAREHYESVKRKAEAIKLLNRLFGEQQSVLAQHFTQPLADRISDYLKGVYGSGARAVVTFDEGAFKGIEIVRPDEHAGARSFDVLSGGAREQVAAAVRLAVAEVLAADHGGSLPVVFDDAFSFSDPHRVQSLQRMLDLAANRGLQVIVLTCNPSDYAALGARQTIFKPVSVRSGQTVTNGTDGAKDAEKDADAAARSSTDSLVTAEDCDAFISALENLGGKSGNQALRENLGWTDEHYAAVKDYLIGQGSIVPGKGRGGSVTLREQS